MDDGYEDAEGEDAEEDDLFAFGELELEEHGKGRDYSGGGGMLSEVMFWGWVVDEFCGFREGVGLTLLRQREW